MVSTLWHINASQHIRDLPQCVSFLACLAASHSSALQHCIFGPLSYALVSFFLHSPCIHFFKIAEFLHYKRWKVGGGASGKSFAQTAQNNSSQQYAEASSHATIPSPLSHPILLSFAPYSQSQSRRQRVSCVKRPQKQFFLLYSYTSLKGIQTCEVITIISMWKILNIMLVLVKLI